MSRVGRKIEQFKGKLSIEAFNGGGAFKTSVADEMSNQAKEGQAGDYYAFMRALLELDSGLALFYFSSEKTQSMKQPSIDFFQTK